MLNTLNKQIIHTISNCDVSSDLHLNALAQWNAIIRRHLAGHKRNMFGVCVWTVSHQTGRSHFPAGQTIRQHEEMFLFFTNTHLQRERDALFQVHYTYRNNPWNDLRLKGQFTHKWTKSDIYSSSCPTKPVQLFIWFSEIVTYISVHVQVQTLWCSHVMFYSYLDNFLGIK